MILLTFDPHQLRLITTLPDDMSAAKLVRDASLPGSSGAGAATLARVSLALFLDPIFVTSYIKRGRLVALSRGSLDVDDVFCVDGEGEYRRNGQEIRCTHDVSLHLCILRHLLVERNITFACEPRNISKARACGPALQTLENIKWSRGRSAERASRTLS